MLMTDPLAYNTENLRKTFGTKEVCMIGEKIKNLQKEYNLQSWSKQKYINPIPVEKAEGIYFWKIFR